MHGCAPNTPLHPFHFTRRTFSALSAMLWIYTGVCIPMPSIYFRPAIALPAAIQAFGLNCYCRLVPPCRIQCIFFLLLNQWRYSFSRSSDFQRAYGRFRLGPNSFDPGLPLAAHWLRLHVYVMPVDSQKIRMPVDKFDDPCDCLSTQYFLCDDEAQIPKKPSANVYVKISRSLQIAKVTGPQIHGGLGDGSLF